MNFFFDFFWSPASRIVPKNVKGGPLGVFKHPFFCKIEKNEGGLFEYIKKIREKSHKAEITCTKKIGQERDWDPHPQKSLINL